MGSLVLIHVLFCTCIYSFISSFAYGAYSQGIVHINGGSSIGTTHSDFICATLDWWPPEKCDYGTCSWGQSSLLNLDLENVIFLNAIKAFSPLKIRLGGSLQDKVTYQSESDGRPCPKSFIRKSSELFGFTGGCLPLSRWDELNHFFNKSGAVIMFGLNALNGRLIRKGSALGNWNSINAESLIRYTVKKGYKIDQWELGNELSGNGVGVSVTANQYAHDTTTLREKITEIYKGTGEMPRIVGPGGFFDATWFRNFIDKAGQSLDVVTHHIYNLGSGRDPHLVDKILNPLYLDGEAATFRQLQNILKNSGTSVEAWVSEAGGAYNSGHNGVSNAFVYSFWYLDQLGMASSYDTKTYCRQTLIGGNYGLLNTNTFVPNPDYYSALLWHRLMGQNVLSTKFNGTKKIRAYTHCSKISKGITLLLINLDGKNKINVKLEAHNGSPEHNYKNLNQYRISTEEHLQLPIHNRAVSLRYEYHLTAKNGSLHSQVMLLNGYPLTVDKYGNIPPLKPSCVNSGTPINVAPYSIVFLHMPYVILNACSTKQI